MTPVAFSGGTTGAVVLAHHQLLVAIPFVVPAALGVLAVGLVMWRDRRGDPDDDHEDNDGDNNSDRAGGGAVDGAPRRLQHADGQALRPL